MNKPFNINTEEILKRYIDEQGFSVLDAIDLTIKRCQEEVIKAIDELINQPAYTDEEEMSDLNFAYSREDLMKLKKKLNLGDKT